MTPSTPSTAGPGPDRPGTTSRRALLRAGLTVAPVLVLGTWGLQAATGAGGQPGSDVAAATGAGQVPPCVVTPQLTEGPYFVDERLIRSDIRLDPATGQVKEGVPLRLRFRLVHVIPSSDPAAGPACGPALGGALVDVWQCDALGVYSDVRDPGFNTVGQKFLRGAQLPDADGIAEFLTIYPGWYPGRTVHTHFKVRTQPDAATGYEFTSQLFYDDALTDLVHAQPPYSAKGQRTLRNDADGIFREGGNALLLDLAEADGGYVATIDIGIDLSAPAPRSGAPGGPPPGGFPPGGPPPGAPPPSTPPRTR